VADAGVRAASAVGDGQNRNDAVEVALYNGTNADDLTDPTRLGLLSALHHRVNSPVCQLSKARVRELAAAAGLPNWNLAAAPCLRSRLAAGVPATAGTLAGVEGAEDAVRRILRLTPEENMRVRVMAPPAAAGGVGVGGVGATATAVIEVDAGRLAEVEDHPGVMRELEAALRLHGLALDSTRAFKSGSVAKQLPSRV
jgi:uncharacterized protein